MFQPNLYNTIKSELKNLTNITYMTLTERGNAAIKIALNMAKKKKKTKCIILDQGGWITYKQFAQELGFEIISLETKDCQIDLLELDSILDSDSVFLLHSLSGYFFKQPMKEIETICKIKKTLLINDCCGSVAFPELLHGDIFVCSFGKWKPLNHGNGGFIGTRDSHLFYTYFPQNDFEFSEPEKMLTVISEAILRCKELNKISQKVIADLYALNLRPIKENSDATLVVLVPFNTASEKEKICLYCKNNSYEYVECPREIRLNRKAISIEIKRLNI